MFFRVIRGLSQQIKQVWEQRVGSHALPLFSAVELTGLGIAVLALWGFTQIADDVFEQETQAFDTAILLFLRGLQTPFLNQVMMGFTFLGEPEVLLFASLGLGVGLFFVRQRLEAVTLAIAAGGGAGLNFWLKEFFARDRPALWDRIVDVRYYSFPSGHATMSMVVYCMIGYLLATRFPRWRGLIVGLTFLVITLVGLSRLYLGVHWPTDVLAGYASGLVWVLACILSLEMFRGRRGGRMASRNGLPEIGD